MLHGGGGKWISAQKGSGYNEKSDEAHKVGLADISLRKLMTMCGLKPAQEDKLPKI